MMNAEIRKEIEIARLLVHGAKTAEELASENELTVEAVNALGIKHRHEVDSKRTFWQYGEKTETCYKIMRKYYGKFADSVVKSMLRGAANLSSNSQVNLAFREAKKTCKLK